MENKMFYQDGKKRFLYDYIFFETTNPIFFSCVDEKKDIYILPHCVMIEKNCVGFLQRHQNHN